MTVPAKQVLAASKATTNLNTPPENPPRPGAQTPPYLWMWDSQGQYVIFCVQTLAGSTSLTFRYSAGYGAAVRRLEVDGVATAPKLAFPATPDWNTWATVTQTVNFKAGWHTVQLSFDPQSSQYINFDNLTVITGPPAPPPFLPVTMAAGKATTNLQTETLQPGAESAPYVINWDQQGQYVLFPPVTTPAGTFSFVFRYAAAATASRKIELDGRIIAADKTFPATGNWQTWSTAVVTQSLTAGPHTIKIWFDGAAGSHSFLNLDNLKVVAGTVQPPPPPAGAGGKAAVRNAMGNQQGRQAWLDSITSHWNQAGNGQPINWKWHSTTCVETDLDIALAEWSRPDAPTVTYRQGNGIAGGAPWTIAQINAGQHDAEIDQCARKLQQLTVAQGKPQILRPLYEGCDQNLWMPWNIAGVSNDQWADAFCRIVKRFKAICPTVKVDLCMNLGYGGGPNAIFTHGHAQWDDIVTKIQARGVRIDYADWDCYSNGCPGGQWLLDELAMIAACALRWGCQIAHAEFGIGGSNSQGPHNWGPVAWANAFLNWWASLPATGPGSLGRIEIFDLGGGGDFPDGRGGVLVPTDGPLFAQAFKTFLA